ncbi:cellulose biosynthesis protein BcsO [Candidatus Sodalis pierantonius]|uniref:cellulose biosynthesis protein BcsO n=1 Tax=Candidatus Sodalis pierantonii TaxID=1486991 RepID=UPI00090070F4|nr:cellulose biosynthesis protein BcsO [Candidatus Sodalis pierantonius]
MNNYDDIKRFKEKLNMEPIDYKEIAENNLNSSASSWTIIKHIVNADKPFHPLEQGHSTLPSPAPISQQEFSARPAAPNASHTPAPFAQGRRGQNHCKRQFSLCPGPQRQQSAGY